MRPYDLSRLCVGVRLRLPVYPHLPLRRLHIATGLEGWGNKGWLLWWMTCVELCLKLSCFAQSQPHSLVPSSLVQGQDGQDGWRPAGVKELPEGWRVCQSIVCGAPLRGPRPMSSYLVARPGHGCVDVALKQNSILAVSPIWWTLRPTVSYHHSPLTRFGKPAEATEANTQGIALGAKQVRDLGDEWGPVIPSTLKRAQSARCQKVLLLPRDPYTPLVVSWLVDVIG